MYRDMNAIKNILFPTDFSQNANKALVYAADIVNRSNGILYLLNVYDIPIIAPSSMDAGELEAEQAITKDARELAEAMLEQLIDDNSLHNLRCVCLVNEGNVKDEILKAIENNPVDLVVMGTKGASAEREIFMGSVTKNVIQFSTAPVLAIPQAATFKPISKIVHATNLENDESNLLSYIVELAKLYSADITALHVNKDFTSGDRNTIVLNDIARSTSYTRISCKEIMGSDVVECLDKYIRDKEADVLAMTSYTTSLINRILHKSLTKEMLLHTHIPLLAFVRKKYDTIFLG